MRLFYSFAIWFYYQLIRLASFGGNDKAKKWLQGRKEWLSGLKKNIPPNAKPYWFHVASLGEFEQAIPIIEEIKQQNSKQFILLSFFSPSGYEIKKNYPLADYVCYLPIDSKSNARTFIQSVNPQKVFFIKYEFWFNFLAELHAKKVDTYLVSGVFRPSQHFFQFYGSWFRKNLRAFNFFFVQNLQSAELLKSIGFENLEVTGDTRLDRVLQITKESFESNALHSFSKNSNVLIFGSSWEREHEIATQFSAINQQDFKLIIAPHEINTSSVNKLKARFNTSVKLWSEVEPDESLANYNILIVDSIGLLSRLYRYGDFAFIGGGFKNSIHNTLEPLAYKIPIFFGPKFGKFQEAVDGVQLNIAFSVNNVNDLIRIILPLSKDKKKYDAIQQKAQQYLNSHSGATNKIITTINASN